MSENKRKIGGEEERAAADFLTENSLCILEYNFRCRFGEIDLIGKDGDTLVFVEVKYRKGTGNGDPAEAVTLKKQKTICRVADYYRMKNQIWDNVSCRFDVVAILGEQITWYQNAFEYRKLK